MVDDRIAVAALAAAAVGLVVGAGAVALATDDRPRQGANSPADVTDPIAPGGPGGPGTVPASDDASVAQFESEAAFERYVRRHRPDGNLGVALVRPRVTVDAAREVEGDAANEAPRRATGDGGAGGGGGGATPDRYSETNVQERGIREPDVLKTDGQTAFFADRGRDGRHDRRPASGTTRVVDVSTPADPSVVANVDVSGRMFLDGDRLVVLSDETVYGYDVSDPGSPERVWERGLNGSVAAARLYDGSIYLVVRKGIDRSDPCPVRPVEGASVGCTEVYRPTAGAVADATYTTVRMDPGDGTVEESVSVVGSRQYAATYVSETAVYLTYTRHASRSRLLVDFLLNESDRLDRQAERRLREIRSYNLSEQARRVEVRTTIRRWLQRVDAEDRERVRRQLRESFGEYLAERKRELVTTGIVKVGIGDGLSVEATGEVPGRPLNQFSMDEQEGRLRIATTVPRTGAGPWIGPRGGEGGQSENDLYVLSENLDVMGKVQGMGIDQRIYSVRYVGDTAYVVTFRRVDPFHVVDLSDPESPEELGQVKLEGFSRYLHPIDDDRILGIGEEDGQVKATVFDVSEPGSPVVEDERVLNAGWSAVARSHHAFLIDRKHGVFFLPTGRGGYVVGYGGNDSTELTVERRVDTRGSARRALYVDDYMYVFGDGGLVVVDETDWSREASLRWDERRVTGHDVPKVRVEWEYSADAGRLRAVHDGGESLRGDRLVLRCDDARIAVDDEQIRVGETVVETERCEAGDIARLLWRPVEGPVEVIGEFEVPS